MSGISFEVFRWMFVDRLGALYCRGFAAADAAAAARRLRGAGAGRCKVATGTPAEAAPEAGQAPRAAIIAQGNRPGF
jgi:hypothetical protein